MAIDTALTLSIADFVSDTEADTVVITSASVEIGTGSVSISSDGLSLTYIPASGFTGDTDITYDVSDGANTLTSTLSLYLWSTR